MRQSIRNISLAALALLGLFLVPAYVLIGERRPAAVEPAQVFAAYVKATYARDFTSAYRLIASLDRRLKPEHVYADERGSFTGFTLEVARKLSEFVRAEPLHTELAGRQARVKLKIQFPDADPLSQLLLDWNEAKLNGLSRAERRRILSEIERLGRQNRLSMLESQEESLLVQEGPAWRVFFNWASGFRVHFQALVPPSGIIMAKPAPTETIVRRKEPFTVVYRVHNRTPRDIFARINHRVEPPALARHLRMFECSMLLPIRLLPGEQGEYSTTYMIDSDLPDGAKEISVTYEFELES